MVWVLVKAVVACGFVEVWFCVRLWWLCSLRLLGGYGAVSGFCVLRVFGVWRCCLLVMVCARYMFLYLGFVCLRTCAACWGLVVPGFCVAVGVVVRFMLFDFVDCWFLVVLGSSISFCGTDCWSGRWFGVVISRR